MKDEIAKLRSEIHARHVEIDRHCREIDRLRTRFARAYFIMVACVAIATVCGWGWFTTNDRLHYSQQIIDTQASAIATMGGQFEDLKALYRIEQERAGMFESQFLSIKEALGDNKGYVDNLLGRIATLNIQLDQCHATNMMLGGDGWTGNAAIMPGDD